MLSNQNNRIFIAKTLPWWCDVQNVEVCCVRCARWTWKSVESKLRHHYFKTWAPPHLMNWTERNTPYNSCAKTFKIYSYNLKHLTSDVSDCSTRQAKAIAKKAVVMENKSFSLTNSLTQRARERWCHLCSKQINGRHKTDTKSINDVGKNLSTSGRNF